MKLTTKGRYAVMAMTDIAAFGDGAPVSLTEISDRQGISQAYLEQLFAKLRRAGLVDSARGVGGGYSLARGADAIRISDIIAAVDEAIKTTACPPGAEKGCLGQSARCLTHDLWDQLGAQIHDFLAGVTLADVIDGKTVRPQPDFIDAGAEA